MPGELAFLQQQAQCMLSGSVVAEQQIAQRQVTTQARQQIVELGRRQLLPLLQLLQGLGEQLTRAPGLPLTQQQSPGL